MAALTPEDLSLLSGDLPALQSIVVPSKHFPDGSGRLCYREAGSHDAPVLVFLHGLGSSSAGYRAQLAGLSDAYRVIAWDAPGFGESSHLERSEPDVWEYADVLSSFVQELGVTRIRCLVGSSWGSIIALAFASRFPELVGTLALSGANTARGNLQEPQRLEEMASRLAVADTSLPVRRSDVADLLLTPDTPAEVRVHVEKLRDAMTTRGWRQAVSMLFTVYTPRIAALVACPVALLAGTCDRIAPPQDHAMRLFSLFPSARLHLFEGFGHMLKLESPSRFNQIVRHHASGTDTG